MFNPKKAFSNYLNTKKLHPVAVNSHDQEERIFLVTEKERRDITDHHALISLNPFAVAVNSPEISAGIKPILQIYDNGNLLGEIILRQDKTVELSGLRMDIYEGSNFSDSRFIPNKLWNSWMLGLKNVTNRKARNFMVPPAELLKLFVYSLKPRPVFLISVAHEKGFDVFPIDILGKIGDGKLLLSIRTTSAAIPHILDQRKLCASSVPFAMRNEAYRFGRHHPGGILPEALREMKFIPSEQLKIPVPSFAISVMELIVEDTFEKGVHTTFLTTIIHSYDLTNEMQLAHVPWFSKKYFKAYV